MITIVLSAVGLIAIAFVFFASGFAMAANEVEKIQNGTKVSDNFWIARGLTGRRR